MHVKQSSAVLFDANIIAQTVFYVLIIYHSLLQHVMRARPQYYSIASLSPSVFQIHVWPV